MAFGFAAFADTEGDTLRLRSPEGRTRLSLGKYPMLTCCWEGGVPLDHFLSCCRSDPRQASTLQVEHRGGIWPFFVLHLGRHLPIHV